MVTPWMRASARTAASAGRGLAPGRGVHDDLGQHRVVVGADRVAGLDARVDPHPGPVVGHGELVEVTGRREPPGGRVLGVEAGLDGVSHGTAGHRLVHLGGQRGAAGDEELEADQVEPGHLLGHRVLDLEPGVHLQEVGLAVRPLVRRVATAGVEDELDGAGVDVPDGPGGGHRGLGQPGPEGRSDDGRRRLLDDLLVTALDAALALEQGDGGTVGVGQDLDLDVAGGRDVPLEEDGPVAEGRQRLAPGPGQGVGQVVGTGHDPHAPPATAGRGLDQERPAERVHLRRVRRGVAVDGDGRQGGHARRPHHVLRPDLRAHGLDGLGGRPDPEEAGVEDGPGERRPTRTGSRSRGGRRRHRCAGPRRGAGRGGGRCRPGDTPGSRTARSASATWGLCGVGVRVDGHRGDAHGPGGAHDPTGDLPAVGHQERGDGAHGWRVRRTGRRSRHHHIRKTP